ncbi:MAG: hypothetical protein AB7S36_12210, partial [Planctomycetota bacterium]
MPDHSHDGDPTRPRRTVRKPRPDLPSTIPQRSPRLPSDPAESASFARTQASPVPPAGSAGARYELGRELGRGGLGLVRLAHDPVLKRELALKTLLQPDDPEARESFVEEAQITGQLEHPN